MEAELLQTVGQIAGIAGLAVGALLLVFRQIIAKNIFPSLKKDHAYGLLRLISILVFTVALAGIGAWVVVETDAAGRTATPRIETHGNGSPVVTGTGGDVTITIDDTPPSAAPPSAAPPLGGGDPP